MKKNPSETKTALWDRTFGFDNGTPCVTPVRLGPPYSSSVLQGSWPVAHIHHLHPPQPPPSHPAPTTSPERQPNPPVSIPEEQTPSPTPSKPVAKVLEILAGRDDPNDRRIRIEVSNPTDKPCTVKGYTVSWGSSKKSMPLADTVIPPGESRQRFLIVHPRDGRVETLTVDGATVDMQYECDR